MTKARFFSFSQLPFVPFKEKVDTRFIAGKNFTFFEHRVKKGHLSGQERHENEQLTWVLQGSLRFTLGDEVSILRAGDMLLIPPDVLHSCEALEESLVIEVFSPSRTDF